MWLFCSVFSSLLNPGYLNRSESLQRLAWEMKIAHTGTRPPERILWSLVLRLHFSSHTYQHQININLINTRKDIKMFKFAFNSSK